MEWEHNSNYHVIVDNGSHEIRSGMGNSMVPTVTFDNLTGRNINKLDLKVKQLIGRQEIFFWAIN